jgi:hypothetical protein
MPILDDEPGLISKTIRGRHQFYLFKDAGQIGQAAQHKIKDDLSAGMTDVNVEGYFKSAGDIFSSFEYLLVAKNLEGENVNGIFACRWVQTASKKMLYIYTTKIISDYQRTPLFASMVSYCFDGIKEAVGRFPEYILYKTVNPIVYRYTRRISEAAEKIQLFPNIPTLCSPDYMRALAKEGAAALCPKLSFDVETGVINGAMKAAGEGYYPEMVRSGSKLVNDYFKENLTLDDQLLGVIHIPEECEANFLAHVRSFSLFKK